MSRLHECIKKKRREIEVRKAQIDGAEWEIESMERMVRELIDESA